MIRDLNSNALISKDKTSLDMYKEARSKSKKIQTLEDEINSINRKLDLIISLLKSE